MPEANVVTSSRRRTRLVALAAVAWAVAGPARADDGAGHPSGTAPADPPVAPVAEIPAVAPPPAPVPPETPAGAPEFTDVTFESVVATVAGVAAAFVVHEACHAVANLSMANVPTLEPVRFLGVLPFFAVSPNIQCAGGACTRRDGEPFAPGPRGYAFIVGSGILCQQVTNEIILTENPRIRNETAPFLKGMLLFNTALSLAYGIANLTGIEPPEGDLHGLDVATGRPQGMMAVAVIASAGLDVARYFLPDVAWLPWVSRGAKVVTLGLMVAF